MKFNSLKDWVLKSKKAIFGFVSTAVVVYISKQGFTLDTTVGEVVNALPSGLVTGVVVWFTRNSK